MSTPAFSVPSRILRTTSGSSPATPPGKRRTVTRPPESLLPALGRLLEDEVPGRAVGHERRHADDERRLGLDARLERDGERGHRERRAPRGPSGYSSDLRIFISSLASPLLDEQLVQPGELEARALLRQQVGETLVGGLRLTSKASAFSSSSRNCGLVLLRDAHALGQHHVRERAPPPGRTRGPARSARAPCRSSRRSSSAARLPAHEELVERAVPQQGSSASARRASASTSGWSASARSRSP